MGAPAPRVLFDIDADHRRAHLFRNVHDHPRILIEKLLIIQAKRPLDAPVFTVHASMCYRLQDIFHDASSYIHNNTAVNTRTLNEDAHGEGAACPATE
jgi:hypothetical protein